MFPVGHDLCPFVFWLSWTVAWFLWGIRYLPDDHPMMGSLGCGPRSSRRSRRNWCSVSIVRHERKACIRIPKRPFSPWGPLEAPVPGSTETVAGGR